MILNVRKAPEVFLMPHSTLLAKAILLLLLLIAGQNLPIRAQDVTGYVNPFIGSDGMGHTFPGACVPFGLVQLSPDTDTIPHNVAGVYQPEVYETCAGYRYSDPTIVGFSHTHFSGTGHSDLGDILLMPSSGVIRLNPGTAQNPERGYRSRYSHASEKASPGYYEVYLEDGGVRVGLTATPRVGVHRYEWSRRDSAHIVLDLSHGLYNYQGKTLWAEVRVLNDTLLTGYRLTSGWARTNQTYFAISLSRPLKSYGFRDRARIDYKGGWSKFDQYHDFPEMAGRDIAAYLVPDLDSQATLTVKVALSGVSQEGALRNLQAEAMGEDFVTLRQRAETLWREELSQILVSGSQSQKRMFYTSLYHTMINPSVYMDVDGRYRGLDREVHQADGFTNYTVFSLWDTYRAEHPLLTLLKPHREEDMVASMIAHYRQSAHHMLPVWSHMGNENWCMSGYHAVSVISDAIAKGLSVDMEGALEAMSSTSNVPYYGGLGSYRSLGYVPLEEAATAASNTLEYAYDDWAIYSAARRAGQEELAETYRKRALNYRNLYDPSIAMARPRLRDGSFMKDFDVRQTVGQGFIEGNSWNFSFHVPHDVYGMMELLGGQKAFVTKMDELFSTDLPEIYYRDNEDVTKDCLIGGYVHGNEPSHHIPYLYAWTSQPWKTQYWTREILNRMYRDQMHGLGGNDDCGQMSAWYIFTCLGFYPVCPGTDEYVLGAPYLPYARLTLPSGRTLEIKAEGVSDKNRYVQSVKLNGKPYSKLYIRHSDLLDGGVLEFQMSSQPNRKRGQRPEDKPYSLTGGI